MTDNCVDAGFLKELSTASSTVLTGKSMVTAPSAEGVISAE